MGYYDGVKLPTVDQVREFAAAINRGREAVGLDPVESFDVMKCVPGVGDACMSATYLFSVEPLFGCVGTTDVGGLEIADVSRLAEALETEILYEGVIAIPRSILAVTDYFDAASELSDPVEHLDRLEAVFDEAGLLAH